MFLELWFYGHLKIPSRICINVPVLCGVIKFMVLLKAQFVSMLIIRPSFVTGTPFALFMRRILALSTTPYTAFKMRSLSIVQALGEILTA